MSVSRAFVGWLLVGVPIALLFPARSIKRLSWTLRVFVGAALGPLACAVQPAAFGLGQDLILWLPFELRGQSMKQVKSVFAGIAAIILICGVLPLVGEVGPFLVFFVRELRAGGVGFSVGNVVWHWHIPTLNEWLSLLSAFGLGYLWELRRLERRELANTGHSSNQSS